MRFIKTTALSGLLVLLFLGCRKPTGANWDVDVTLPVVNSILNIKNFVNDSLYATDNTGLVYVTLNREVAAIKLDSLISIPDTVITRPFLSVFQLTLQPGQSIPSTGPSELKFQIDKGMRIKRVGVQKGSLTVKFSNTVSQPVNLVYEVTSATKDGHTLRISETVPTGTNSLVKTYDLTGYDFNMRGLSGLTYNTIVQTYTVSVSPDAQTVVVLQSQGAVVEVSYSELVPAYVEGYFGQQVIDIKQDTASLGLSENFKASNFMLSDATMDFTIVNEFGAEFSASLSNNKSINTINNNIVTLNSDQLSNVNVNRATKSGNTIFPGIKPISFTSMNSNISSFVSNLPDKLTYKGSVSINPRGNIYDYTDFAFYNTGIRLLANINIPLRFTADYFELRTEAETDFSDVSQLDDVNNGSFVILASNGFPFSTRLQAYMYDAQNTLIDSLFVPGENIIPAGTLNASNIVVAPVQKKVSVNFGKARIENLRKCKTIRIVSRFIMPPNPPEIKILDSYEVKVSVVANVNYNVGFGN